MNFPAGTQIVTLMDACGSHGAVVHARGAVGIITRTPCGHEDRFTVRFPDGFEAQLAAGEMIGLKQYKSDNSTLQTTPPFHLEDHLLYRCVVGSRAFGLETEDSDTDRRGIYLAPPDLQWSLFGAPDQFEDNADQVCYWELQKFMLMALKANPNILECLYSPVIEKVTPMAAELLARRQVFMSQMIFQTFNGYALSQFKKIEQDLRNQGQIKWKHAMHLLRLLISGARALREGHVPVDVGHHREALLAVKRGERSWDDVNTWRQQLHCDFEQARAQSKLPERPDYSAANSLLIRLRRDRAAG